MKKYKTQRQTKRRTRKNKKRGGSSNNIKMDISNITTGSKPTIFLPPLKISTLVMYDVFKPSDNPDAPSTAWLHYLVINIPNGDISKGDVIMPYTGPSPPPGSGPHHYIFELLAQTSPFITSIQERSNFDINQFKQQHNLFPRAKKQFIVNA